MLKSRERKRAYDKKRTADPEKHQGRLTMRRETRRSRATPKPTLLPEEAFRRFSRNWNRLPEYNPNKAIGKMMLDAATRKVQRKPEQIVSKDPLFLLENQLQFAWIFHDVLRNGKVIDSVQGCFDETCSSAEFLYRIAVKPLWKEDKSLRPSDIYSLVASATKDGACQAKLRRHLDLYPEMEVVEGSQDVVFSAASAITPPHIDNTLQSQLSFCKIGQKVWLTWPASAYNLSRFAKYHRVPSGNTTLALVQELDLLSATVQEADDTLFLQAGTIHAVLTVKKSLLCGAYVLERTNIDNGINAARWEFELTNTLHSTDRGGSLAMRKELKHHCQMFLNMTKNDSAETTQFRPDKLQKLAVLISKKSKARKSTT